MLNYKKVLSILLIITFLSANMPISTLAKGIEELDTKIVSSEHLGGNIKEKSKILQEVEAKREIF